MTDIDVDRLSGTAQLAVIRDPGVEAHLDERDELGNAQGVGRELSAVAESCHAHHGPADGFDCLDGAAHRAASGHDVFDHKHVLAADEGIVAALDDEAVTILVREEGQDVIAVEAEVFRRVAGEDDAADGGSDHDLDPLAGILGHEGLPHVHAQDGDRLRVHVDSVLVDVDRGVPAGLEDEVPLHHGASVFEDVERVF